MSSRMDRYKNLDENLDNTMYGRSNKNRKLYDDMNYDVFSSNETVIDTSNEIDITKLKQMINNREDFKKTNSYRNILEDKNDYNYDYIKEQNAKEYEEKSYDINELITKVKKEKQENNSDDDIKKRKLVNTQYDILSRLDVKSKNHNIDDKEEKDRLDELVNTVIKEEEEKNESLDLFEDLKGENTIITEGFKDADSDILPLYNEEMKKPKKKEVEKQEEEKEDDDDLDSFLSGSMVFNDEDFEDFKNIDKKHGNLLIKIIIFVLIVVACTVAIFILDSMYHFIPF